MISALLCKGSQALKAALSAEIVASDEVLNALGDHPSYKYTMRKITYTERDGYLYPDLEFPEQEEVVIGRWGQKHKRFLKKTKNLHIAGC